MKKEDILLLKEIVKKNIININETWKNTVKTGFKIHFYGELRGLFKYNSNLLYNPKLFLNMVQASYLDAYYLDNRYGTNQFERKPLDEKFLPKHIFKENMLGNMFYRIMNPGYVKMYYEDLKFVKDKQDVLIKRLDDLLLKSQSEVLNKKQKYEKMRKIITN